MAIPIFAAPVFAREDERKNTDDSKSESPTDHQEGEYIHEAEIGVERVSPEVMENIEKLKDEMLKEIASQAVEIFKEQQKKTREQRELEDEMDKFEVKFGTIDTRFEHVIGNSELKTELLNILKFMKHPDKYFKMGASLPNGCIINGPHGSGKTLLARAMAGKACYNSQNEMHNIFPIICQIENSCRRPLGNTASTALCLDLCPPASLESTGL